MCSLFEDRGEYADSKLHLISKKFIQEVKGAERVTRKKKKKKKRKTWRKRHWTLHCKKCIDLVMPPCFFLFYLQDFCQICLLFFTSDDCQFSHHHLSAGQDQDPSHWSSLANSSFFSITGVTENCHIHAWASLMISYFPRMKTNSVSTS